MKKDNNSFLQKYAFANWQPLAIGIIIGFVIRELLVIALLAVIAYAMVIIVNKKNTEKVKK